MEGGRTAWGLRVGANQQLEQALLPNSVFFASLVLPDPERGTMPVYLLPPPTPRPTPQCLETPKFPYSALPLPVRCARPCSLTSSPRHACLSTLQPEGSTHRTPSEGRSPGGGCGCGGDRLSIGWHWETLRCPSPNRDFAYVARDKLTQMLKCHVFRCEAPAKNIATSLHEICSKARPVCSLD